VSTFGDSKLGNISRFNPEVAKLAGKPEGAAMTVEFTLEGYNFRCLVAGRAEATARDDWRRRSRQGAACGHGDAKDEED